MENLNISKDFTIEDIHKIREYNYESTKNMSFEERKNYYESGADRFKKRLNKFNKSKGT